MTESDPSVEDIHTGSSFKEVVARVLDLQVSCQARAPQRCRSGGSSSARPDHV
jgi:hypothetical protein